MATLPASLVADLPIVGGTKGRFSTFSATLAGPLGPAVVTYKLSARRTSDGVRIYWGSSERSLQDAPGGSGLYNATTLIEEAAW